MSIALTADDPRYQELFDPEKEASAVALQFQRNSQARFPLRSPSCRGHERTARMHAGAEGLTA
jgi:hypothetical protein